MDGVRLVFVSVALDGMVPLVMNVQTITTDPHAKHVHCFIYSYYLVFNPLIDCDATTNCNGNGVCDQESGACVCNVEWTGSTCSECSTHYYGDSCETCMCNFAQIYNINFDHVSNMIPLKQFVSEVQHVAIMVIAHQLELADVIVCGMETRVLFVPPITMEKIAKHVCGFYFINNNHH